MTSEMDDLPQGWARTDLGEIVEILDSRRVPINAEERAKRPGDVPYYGATGQVGTIDDYLFDEELVLLGEDGDPFLDTAKPKAYMIRGKSWVNNHAHVLRGTKGLLNTFLMYQLTRADYGSFVSGTTRLKLPQGEMRKMPLVIPPLNEQRRIVAEVERRLSVVEEMERAIEANLKRAERLRQAILARAFAGRLVAQDPSDEPASVLLERIRAERVNISSSTNGRQRRRTAARQSSAS